MSLVGIELLTIDAGIVIASVDTYLRFAEAVNRLDISDQRPGADRARRRRGLTSRIRKSIQEKFAVL